LSTKIEFFPMKILVPLFFLLISNFCEVVKADERYTIIKVIGNIEVKKTGNLLSAGDEISANEAILYKTPQSKASVISNQRGRFVLSQNPKVGDNTIQNNLIPAMSNISSRSGAILNLIDVKNYFSKGIVLLGISVIKIPVNLFSINDSSFFYLSFEHNGEQINKKLPQKLGELVLDPTELFKIDGQPIVPKESNPVKLFYKSGQTIQWINDFSIVIPNEKQLINEVGIIISQTDIKTSKEKTEEIKSFISEFYGSLEESSLNKWLRDKFQLESKD